MKKLSTAIIIVLVLFSSVAATMAYELRNSSAEVEQIQGMYIFSDSKPLREYEYLGTVTSTITISGQYEPVRNMLLKKARKEFPTGDGLILHLVNGGVDKADIIKFK